MIIYSELQALMVSRGYVQLVNEPTTDRATLKTMCTLVADKCKSMYVMYTIVIMMLYTAQCHCEMFNVFTCLTCLHVFNVTAFHGKQSNEWCSF